MKKQIKFRFDPDQLHQVKAIESTIKLFDEFKGMSNEFQMGDEIVANMPANEDQLDEEWLLGNLNEVRQDNGLSRQNSLQYNEGFERE